MQGAPWPAKLEFPSLGKLHLLCVMQNLTHLNAPAAAAEGGGRGGEGGGPGMNLQQEHARVPTDEAQAAARGLMYRPKLPTI